jgi:hypothetical protein
MDRNYLQMHLEVLIEQKLYIEFCKIETRHSESQVLKTILHFMEL